MRAENLKVLICAQCKCRFAIPMALFESALCSDKIGFFCPYGHDLRFPGKTDEVEEKDNVVQLHIVKKENDA